MVCIGIPTYNRPQELKRAVDSCLAQTYKNIIVFVSDNCSEDPELEPLCREYEKKDSRIKYVRQKENIGMGANGQYLLDNVVGEYYFTMGDDDWISENFIEECMKIFISNPNAVLACGLTQLIKEDGSITKLDIRTAKSMLQDNYMDRIKFYYHQLYCSMSHGVRKVSDIKKMDKGKSRICEDWIEITKYIFLGKFYIVNNCTYHKMYNGPTSSIENIKEYFNLSPTLSVSEVQDIFTEASRDAILNDEFYHRHLSKKERKKLALLVYYSLKLYRQEKERKFSEALKYMMYNPRFLFDEDFYSLFCKRETKQMLDYMNRHPLFLFHKEFYNIRHKNKILMEKNPLVSIVIPTYNRRDLLKKAIESAANQFYKNLEIIIADDNSDDGTEELCREHAAKDSRIKYFRHNENIGTVANSNFAATQITGEYWTSLNDDNRLSRNYIEECLSFMLQNPDYSIVFPLIKMFDQNDNLLDTSKPYRLNHRNVNKRIASFVKNNSTHISNGFYKTSILKTMIKNDGGIFKHNLTEDRTFMIKNLIAGKGYVLNDIYFHKIDYGFSENLDLSKKSDLILKDKVLEQYLNEKQRKNLQKLCIK